VPCDHREGCVIGGLLQKKKRSTVKKWELKGGGEGGRRNLLPLAEIGNVDLSVGEGKKENYRDRWKGKGVGRRLVQLPELKLISPRKTGGKTPRGNNVRHRI